MVQAGLLTEPADCIFDVGAHVGAVTRILRRLHPTAQIFAFEPSGEAVARLRIAFGRDRRTEIHELALADRTGVANLHINEQSQTNSLLATDSRSESFWGVGNVQTIASVPVKLMTLDGFCRARGIERIDILKMDVQGSEYDVLVGAKNMLENHHVGMVYSEVILAPTYVGQRAFREYQELLSSHGYELLDLYNQTHKGNRLIQFDALFVSPSFRPPLKLE